MYALRQYIANVGALRDFAGMVARFPLTQAVFVEPDDIWTLAWRIRRTEPWYQDVLDRSSSVAEGDRTRGWWYFHYAAGAMGVGPQVEVDPEHDFAWYPQEIQRILRTQHPLWVRVHLCRRADMSAEAVAGQRKDIEGIALKFRGEFRITLEDRPRALLAIQSGDKINGSGPGTVGGFLQDRRTKDIYGVTCAHVADSGSVTDARGRAVGTVIAASALNKSPSGQLCNPSAGVLNDLDVSLFSCPWATSSGFGGHSTLFGSGQTAQMRGGFSHGPHRYSVGGIGIIQTLHHGGSDYCFKDLFSFRPRPTAPLPTSAAIALSPVPLGGDSGSWITINGAGGQPDWIGMLIGIDLVEGFAVDAAKVHQWASLQTGSALDVW